MSIYKIADLNIALTPRSGYVQRIMEPYLTQEQTPDLEIAVSDDDIAYEKQISDVMNTGVCESTAILRKLCHRILFDFNGIFLHSAVIVCGGKAYAFVAPSGTGKTTHIRLWKKVFGDDVYVLNGDKPLIREIDGKFIVYGNPWQGKENYGVNGQCELAGIYLLNRAEQNSISKPTSIRIFHALIHATVFPESADGRMRVMDFFERMLLRTKVLILNCNMQDEAAYVARRGMEDPYED